MERLSRLTTMSPATVTKDGPTLFYTPLANLAPCAWVPSSGLALAGSPTVAQSRRWRRPASPKSWSTRGQCARLHHFITVRSWAGSCELRPTRCSVTGDGPEAYQNLNAG